MCRPAFVLSVLLLSLGLAAAINLPIVGGLVDKVVGGSSSDTDDSDPDPEGPEVAAKFQDFVDSFNVAFKDPEEQKHRRGVFAKNLGLIKRLNAKKAGGAEGALFGINKFSHLTPEEFKKMMLPGGGNFTVPDHLRRRGHGHGNRTRPAPGPRFHGRSKRQSLPTNFDWRTYGVVTSVKNQGSCGCCWAFAATGAVESQYALWIGGSLPDLAEQELLNCDPDGGSCNGGTYHSALDNVMNNGQHFESAAPYQMAKKTCTALSGSKVYVESNDQMWDWSEDDMKQYLYDWGPFAISFGMGADTQNYKSGIYSSNNCPGINHAMLAVGYGVENNVPYWLVKNQWGTGWGISGYMKIKRNVNMCGFAQQNVGPYYAYLG